MQPRAHRAVWRGLLLTGLLGLALVSVRLWPKPPLGSAVPRSTAVYARGGELLRLTLASDGQYRLWTPYEALPPRLADAVVLYEDRAFYWHPGVNPLALLRAACTDLQGGRRLGASTLTMQLARRLYHLDTHSLRGKLVQIGAALLLEARYGKHDILEAYLNLVPYGGNVEGVGAASLAYFGRAPAGLSLAQSMTLAVVPQNPQARRPSVSDARAGARDAARARLFAAWLTRHPADASYAGELALPTDARAPQSLPFLAPHLTDLLVRRQGGAVYTTLDLPAQRALERIARGYFAQQGPSGVRNGGALLLELTGGTAQVRAYVGSADYRDAGIEGQVNAVSARRSPGSLLKPFVYALALDQGLLHPRSILKDAPTAFGPFSPENFDGRFTGPIAVEDALIRSRNVPAVAVASRLSHPNLYDFLVSAGVSSLDSEAHYGLALTLGGGEVSMEELGRMYATLLNGGRLPEVSALADAPARSGPQLLSAEASYVTLDMLTRNPRPDTGQPAVPAVAWKTGTSWGFHDAWSAAVFGDQVLVVWIGNFDNTANPAFVGVQAAAPLLFRLIDGLRSQGLSPAVTPAAVPPGLSRVEVCAASGELPNADCPQTVSTWYLPGKSPIRTSTLHQRVYLDADGRRVCGPGPGIHADVFEFWSSDMLQLFREAGLPRRTPPPAPACDSAPPAAHAAPQITSPLRGVTYTLRAGRAEPLMLRATAGAATRELYWFAGTTYLGRASESLPWRPAAAGRYTLRAVDEYGDADTREVTVDVLP